MKDGLYNVYSVVTIIIIMSCINDACSVRVDSSAGLFYMLV